MKSLIAQAVQKAVDKVANKLGNENKTLKEQLKKEQAKNLTVEEIKKLELEEKERELEQQKMALQMESHRMYALKALKKAKLDDGSEDSLELIELVQRKIILKTKARQDILERLQGYLDREIQEAIEILSGFWKNQQEAMTYQELQEAIFSMWQQDYSILVDKHMKKWWDESIVQGAAEQPIASMLHNRGFRFDGMSKELSVNNISGLRKLCYTISIKYREV